MAVTLLKLLQEEAGDYSVSKENLDYSHQNILGCLARLSAATMWCRYRCQEIYQEIAVVPRVQEIALMCLDDVLPKVAHAVFCKG